MAKKSIEKLIGQMAEPIAENLGYELVDVEYVKEGAAYFLRIYIDKPEGITIDDCSAMNNAIEPEIDRADPITNAYYLEVSSPGLERPLKSDRDFEKYSGESVQLNLFEAMNGIKHYEGKLVGRINDCIIIKDGDKELSFPKEKVSTIKRLVIMK